MSEAATSHITRALVEHAVTQTIERLPQGAADATRTFLLDSLGVGICGSRVPLVADMKSLAASWGEGRSSRIWVTGERVPMDSAAFINGYQIHNQEFDCVHEPAVVHPMAVVAGTLLAYADARGGVSGEELLVALSTAVDVATTIGSAATNKLRFFRPAMCGALGAVAGIANLEHLDRDTTWSAFGLAYSQLSGTMQAHVEGSPVLPMQIGFNARAALSAVHLAKRGIQGPRDFLFGAFGYYALFDNEMTVAPFEGLGRVARMAEISHKPFPSGRATHGGVDGLLTLQAEHGFTADDVAEARVIAPPLVIQLVDRKPSEGMAPSYARLCLPYVAACALTNGTVDVDDFDRAKLDDANRLALSARIRVVKDANPSLNALAPQRVEVDLRSGKKLSMDLPAVLGSPNRPLTRERHLAKFRGACRKGAIPLDTARIETLITTVDRLESVTDVRQLIDLLIAPAQ